jgi:hypothetical protein
MAGRCRPLLLLILSCYLARPDNSYYLLDIRPAGSSGAVKGNHRLEPKDRRGLGEEKDALSTRITKESEEIG